MKRLISPLSPKKKTEVYLATFTFDRTHFTGPDRKPTHPSPDIGAGAGFPSLPMKILS